MMTARDGFYAALGCMMTFLAEGNYDGVVFSAAVTFVCLIARFTVSDND